MKTRQRMLATAVAAILGLAGCGSSGESGGGARTVHVGYIADFSGSSVFAVAQKQGLFAKQGLKADLKVFTNGPLQIQAFGTKNLDFGYIGPGALWLPASGKAKVIAVNQLGLADHVIAQPGKGINTIADLRGKKIAVPEGTSGDMILRLALKKAGMSINDVNVVNMDPSTVVSAFTSGSVDAAAIWYPLINTIKKRKPNIVDLAGDQEFYPQTTFPNAIVADNDVVAKDPELVKKFLKVIQQANDWIANNPRETSRIDAEFLKVPVDQLDSSGQYVKLLTTAQLVTATQNGTVGKWLDGLTQIFTEMGKINAPGRAKDFYTSDLYVAAAKG